MIVSFKRINESIKYKLTYSVSIVHNLSVDEKHCPKTRIFSQARWLLLHDLHKYLSNLKRNYERIEIHFEDVIIIKKITGQSQKPVTIS